MKRAVFLSFGRLFLLTAFYETKHVVRSKQLECFGCVFLCLTELQPNLALHGNLTSTPCYYTCKTW